MKPYTEKKSIDIIFLLHTPPPVHGSSMVGKWIMDSKKINTDFDSRYINLLASKLVEDSGHVSVSKIIGFIGVWFQLLGELVKQRPKLCYFALTATGAAFYKDVLLVALLRLFGVRRVYHMHNKSVSQAQSKKINKLLYRFVFADADVILLSELLYKDIETFVPIKRIHICPNGIADINSTSNLVTKNVGNPVRILFLSNLIESKGVFVLLEACSLLKKKDISFQCVFVGSEGDVNLSAFNEKVKQLGLDKSVSYLGKKYGEEKHKILSSTDIFAFPTYYSNECFPLVLLEAMSAGLPIVSTFEGGIPDVVEDGITGFLIPQRNVEILVEKMELLISNPELRQRMGNAGRMRYEQKFTLEIFEHRLVGILQRVLKKNMYAE